MSDIAARESEVAALQALAVAEIDRIKAMKGPVVRVCGPLTCDGPDGYDTNAARLTQAEQYLIEQGKDVWTFGESEEQIFGRGYTDENIFTHFHQPILESKLIQEAYFLPRWDESGGATKEREIAAAAGVAIQEVPEEWLRG